MNDAPSSSNNNTSSVPQTTGTLRTTISLKSCQIVTPFHTFKPSLPPKSEIQGSLDLISTYDLGGVFQQFCTPLKLREDLSSFLPHLYGNFNFSASQDASSLQKLVEKPPIHKEITNLSNTAMQGFKLTSGPVDERYRHLFEKRKDGMDQQLFYDKAKDMVRMKNLEPLEAPGPIDEDPTRKKHKKKKNKKEKKKKKKEEEAARRESSIMALPAWKRKQMKEEDPSPMEL